MFDSITPPHGLAFDAVSNQCYVLVSPPDICPTESHIHIYLCGDGLEGGMLHVGTVKINRRIEEFAVAGGHFFWTESPSLLYTGRLMRVGVDAVDHRELFCLDVIGSPYGFTSYLVTTYIIRHGLVVCCLLYLDVL